MPLGKAFVSLAELYTHSVHSKHDIYSKLKKINKLLIYLIEPTSKSEEEQLIT